MHIVNRWFWQWEEALSKDFCNQVIKEAKESNNKKKATVAVESDKKDGEYAVDKKIRKTSIVWMDQMSPIGCAIQVYINAANKHAEWDYEFSYLEQVQIGHYTAEEKSFYDWHIDTSEPNSRQQQRKLSVSVMLSDPSTFEGGNFEIQGLDPKHKLLQKQGSILVFPSFINHRVTTVKKGERYSAVSWMNGPKWK